MSKIISNAHDLKENHRLLLFVLLLPLPAGVDIGFKDKISNRKSLEIIFLQVI